MSGLIADLRFAARGLPRNAGFTLAVAVTLALGIGATTAVFSVVYGVAFRPLPYPNADRAVGVHRLGGITASGELFRENFRPRDLQAWRDRSTMTSAIALYDDRSAVVTGAGDPAQLLGAEVSAAFFDVLGTRPEAGRTLRSGDEGPGAEPAVVLSHDTWASRLGSDPDAVGRVLRLDGTPHRIVGVMPREFRFPPLALASGPLDSDGRDADAPSFWVPVPVPENTYTKARPVIALLEPGVTPEQAAAEGSLILQPEESLNGPPPPGRRYAGVVGLADVLAGPVQPVLWMFQAAVALVLLVACVNVTNLLLARAAHRRAELIVRAALGATRGRLVRYAVVEVLLLALTGGVLGGMLAYALVGVVRRLPPHVLPRLGEIQFDQSTLAFACLLSIGVGVLVGLASAFRVLRPELWRALPVLGSREGSGGAARQRPSRVLVVVQVAAAIVLLSSAGLLLQSFTRLLDVDSGVEPEGVLLFRTALPETRYATGASRGVIARELTEVFRALPGVAFVGFAPDGYVLGSSMGTMLSAIDGTPTGETTFASFRQVSDGFFEALGIPILAGRSFRPDDRGSSRTIAVVSEAFAREHFAGRSAVGHRIRIGEEREIVGVAGNVRSHPSRGPLAEVYLPADDPGEVPPRLLPPLAWMVRTTGDAMAVAPAIRQAVAGRDPELAVHDVRPLDELIGRAFVGPRFYGVVAGTLAATALVLALVGLYGVLAYSVATRKQEFGIRMALGGRTGGIVGGVMREGLTLAGAGVVIGLMATFWATGLIRAQLFGVTPHDPGTLIAVSMLFAVVSAVACYLPARRATRVDPAAALRAE